MKHQQEGTTAFYAYYIQTHKHCHLPQKNLFRNIMFCYKSFFSLTSSSGVISFSSSGDVSFDFLSRKMKEVEVVFIDDFCKDQKRRQIILQK